MAFSVSFVFKASDKYSKVMTSMARATRKQAQAMKQLASAARQTKNSMKLVSASVSSAGSRFTQSSAKIRRHTNALNQATSAARKYISVAKGMRGINPGRLPRNPGMPGGPGGRGGRQGGRFGFMGKHAEAAGMLGDAALSVGTIGGAMMAPMIGSINAARGFESSFANLRKVFDGTNEELQITKQNILQMAQTMPMSAEGIIDIAAAASEAGIKFKELKDFTDIAIKASIAFDMTAEDVGDRLVKTRTQFGMNINQLRDYGDQVNYLSNNMASSASEIVNTVMEIGNQAHTLGLSAGQTAAFASALIDTGTKADRADGALKDLFTTLTAINILPKTGRVNLQNLMGIDPDTFGKMMKKDALGTMLKLLDKARAKGKAGGDMLAGIFGKQYISEIQGLANNLPKLKQALTDVADRQKFMNSMQKEYEIRSQTFNNALQMFMNNLQVLGITIGNLILPYATKLLQIITPMIMNFTKWASENRGLVMTVVGVAAAIGALLVVLGGIAGIAWFIAPILTLFASWGAITAGVGAAVTALGGIVAAIFTGPVLIAVGIITALAAGVIYCWKNFEGFRNLVAAFGNVAVAAGQSILSGLVAPFKILAAVIKGTLGLIVQLASKITGLSAAQMGANFNKNLNGMFNQMAKNVNKEAERIRGNSPSGKTKASADVRIDVRDPGAHVRGLTASASGANVSVARTGRQMAPGFA